MSLDLSNPVGGSPERFVPDQMQGDLVEAEHLVRYWWASGLAVGRRVLDAGCGVGYGTSILARAGAATTVGVDLASAVIESIVDDGSGASFVQADVKQLPFSDGSFDLVVCFEVIEHVDDQEAVAAELIRVLSDEGILLVSTPNPRATVPGNPHHVRELEPEELRLLLSRRLEHIRLDRQHDWVASAIVDDAAALQEQLAPVSGLQAAKTTAAAPGHEPYTIALASHAPLPQVEPRLVATGLAEPRRWLDRFAAQQEVLQQQKGMLERHRAEVHEIGELHLQLERSEAEIARLFKVEAQLEEQTASLRQRLEHAQDDNRILAERIDRADRVMRTLKQSLSWRVTSPLRLAKRVARDGD